MAAKQLEHLTIYPLAIRGPLMREFDTLWPYFSQPWRRQGVHLQFRGELLEHRVEQTILALDDVTGELLCWGNNFNQIFEALHALKWVS
jgi:hypothetical protein